MNSDFDRLMQAPELFGGLFFVVREYEGNTASGTFSCECFLKSPEHALTSFFPGLAEFLLEKYSELSRHACDNNKSASFIYELKDTELAHALEHLIAEEIASLGVARLDIVGRTGWKKEGDKCGPYRIIVTAPIDKKQFESCLYRAASSLDEACAQSLFSL